MCMCVRAQLQGLGVANAAVSQHSAVGAATRSTSADTSTSDTQQSPGSNTARVTS
jgi:hypothetical protein